MWDALSVLGLGLLGGTLGGALGAGMIFARFSRRCTSLEWAIGDLQERGSTFKGRDMAKKRWDKAEQFDKEMAQVLQSPAVRTKKYDNDPLGMD